MENTISFIIITKNQESNIQNCLNSISKYANEVIIVDTGSTDNTLNILKKNEKVFSNLHIYKYPWKDSFADARNFALKQASCKWIFFIDSDEIFCNSNTSLKDYFNSLSHIEDINYKVISIYRTSFMEKGCTHEYEDRIFRNNGYFHFFGYVHEEIRNLKNEVPSKFVSNIQLNHYGYTKKEMVNHNKIKRNINLLSKNLENEPHNQRWLYLISRDGQKVISSNKLINIIIPKLFLKSMNYERTDVLNLSKTPYKKDLIVNLCLLYLDIKDSFHASLLISIYDKKTIQQDPDLLYCRTLLDLIELYKKKLSLLNNFITSRNKITDSGRISKIDAMNHNLDDLTAYILFDTKRYSLSKDYFELLKDYQYPTLFSEESKLLNNSFGG